MTMQATVKTKRFFSCPNGCAHDFSIEHLMGPAEVERECGPWRCDVCNDAWMPTTHADGTVTVRKTEREKWRRQFVVLELPPQSKPVRFLLRTASIAPAAEAWESAQYLYEEGTCPTNWFGDVEHIVFDGDEDPHGLFALVAVYDGASAEGQVLEKLTDASNSSDYPEGWVDLVAPRATTEHH